MLSPLNINRVSLPIRIPHGVRQVEGVRDPAKGRIVLHGW